MALGDNSRTDGSTAGPVVSQILSEVLPYMGIPSDDNSNNATTISTTTIPNVRNMTLEEAITALQNARIYCKLFRSKFSEKLL